MNIRDHTSRKIDNSNARFDISRGHSWGKRGKLSKVATPTFRARSDYKPRGSYDAPKCTYFASSTTLTQTAQRLWPLHQKGCFLPLDISVREDIDIVQEHGATLWVLEARLYLNSISTVLFLT